MRADQRLRRRQRNPLPDSPHPGRIQGDRPRLHSKRRRTPVSHVSLSPETHSHSLSPPIIPQLLPLTYFPRSTPTSTTTPSPAPPSGRVAAPAAAAAARPQRRRPSPQPRRPSLPLYPHRQRLRLPRRQLPPRVVAGVARSPSTDSVVGSASLDARLVLAGVHVRRVTTIIVSVCDQDGWTGLGLLRPEVNMGSGRTASL